MKARDIRAGNEIDGWTVMAAREAGMWVGPLIPEEYDTVILLTLKYPEHTCRYMDSSANEIEEDVPASFTRRWFRADEEVWEL